MQQEQGSIFEDVKIRWEDKEYVIPSNRVMGAIALIEEHVTLRELGEGLHTKSVPLVKLSRAYGSVLRYAGAKDITDEFIYGALFKKGIADGAAVNSIMGLLAMMIPPQSVQKTIVGGDKENLGESDPATQERRSSRRRSRSR